MSVFTKKSFGASGLFAANPDLGSGSSPRGVVRAPKPICPRCWARPSKYALCDERGHKVSEAGLCERCVPVQSPDDDDLLSAYVANADVSAPADEATVDAAHADFHAYKMRCNDAWFNADALLGELNEKRARFNYICKIGPEADGAELDELEARIGEIESDYLFLDELEGEPPFPELL